jgi:hypothetical protein
LGTLSEHAVEDRFFKGLGTSEFGHRGCDSREGDWVAASERDGFGHVGGSSGLG